MQEFDIDDINMDKSGFGLENGLPYCNTKFCLALFTKELAKYSSVHSYAYCPGIVNTPITNGKNVAIGLRFFYKISRSSLSVTADQAAAEYAMFCALENSIKHESGQVFRFRKLFHQANEKLDAELANRLWKKSSEMVRLDERLARVN